MSAAAWTAIGTIASLILAVFGWYIKKKNDKQKEIDDEDKKIDSASDADSITRELDRLRNK